MSLTKTKGPTEEEWTFHKERLVQLYVSENKPLHQVMSLMVEMHGFVAK